MGVASLKFNVWGGGQLFKIDIQLFLIMLKIRGMIENI